MSATHTQARPHRRVATSRELLVRALEAAGAVSCRLYADDLSFASIGDAISARSGIAQDEWLQEDFWERHLYPDDRSIIDETRRGARMGWRDLNVSFRVAGDGALLALRLVAHRSAEPAEQRPVFEGYLITALSALVLSGDDDSARSSDLEALQQSRRDIMRTSHLAVAGELVGAITHDLRQPLTAMQMNLEVAIERLAKSPADVDEAIAALQDALAGSVRLNESLQVLHNLVGHRRPARGVVNLHAVVNDAARLVRSEANARHVQLMIATSATLPDIAADPSMVQEAVLSILLNAVESAYSPSGLASVNVALHGLPDSGAELLVTYNPRTLKLDDDSWALRIAHSVAEAHGAMVHVETMPDRSTTVRMVWPSAYAA
jgi:signal transduction histidine kinase